MEHGKKTHTILSLTEGGSEGKRKVGEGLKLTKELIAKPLR